MITMYTIRRRKYWPPHSTPTISVGKQLYDDGVHLMLFEPQWRSPTYTVVERRADSYAIITGMCIPNTDDETGRENK